MLISVTCLRGYASLLMHKLDGRIFILALARLFINVPLHCYHIMGCLRVHSKYSLACHWLFNWPGMEEQDYEEEFFGDEHAN